MLLGIENGSPAVDFIDDIGEYRVVIEGIHIVEHGTRYVAFQQCLYGVFAVELLAHHAQQDGAGAHTQYVVGAQRHVAQHNLRFQSLLPAYDFSAEFGIGLVGE